MTEPVPDPFSIPPGLGRVAPYQLLRKLAPGGMGAVCVAEQATPRHTSAT